MGTNKKVDLILNSDVNSGAVNVKTGNHQFTAVYKPALIFKGKNLCWA